MLKRLFHRIFKAKQAELAQDNEGTTEESAFSSLSPVDDISTQDEYVKALKWALNNRKEADIKNIALTGPYGSGKSSVLKTFQKHYEGQNLHFLNISLATFKDEKKETNGERSGIPKEELLRLIEISILQQIFYHEKDKDIPDSRFKRIISYSRKKLLWITGGTILFSLAVLNLTSERFLPWVLEGSEIKEGWSTLFHIISLLVVFLGGGLLIFKSIRIFSSITINKLVIRNTEIGLEGDINKSILNHHLDEILYFFRVRPYNVVVIEDLDRFEETEIFTKLREINLLLNKSKKTKGKEIVFIYAVRDDMFSDNERIKFFDFIIPIIPVINSYNSGEILLAKNEKHEFGLSEDFIDNISYFIDDMRLLHNISNEYFLYKKKLDETLNEDKLFAIITYKNIHPIDFVQLSRNSGHLFKIFNSKDTYIDLELQRIDQEISKLTEYLETLVHLKLKSKKELRMLYLLQIIEQLDYFSGFAINGVPVNHEQMLEDDSFELLVKGEVKFEWESYYQQKTRSNITVDFADIEDLVDSEKSYSQREQEILDFDSGKANSIKQEIKSLERKKVIVKGTRLSTLIREGNSEIKIPKELDEDLIRILVRNRYIEEDYLDYVSIFHEGSITRNDHKFVLSVKNQEPLVFDYKLSKHENLIKKINLADFNTEYVFNHSLLEFLLKRTEQYAQQVDHFFSKLGDGSKSSMAFFISFINESAELEPFFKLICHHWPNIWNYIEKESLLPDEEKSKIFRYIIDFADASSISKIADQSNFDQVILGEPQFLSLVDNQNKLREIIYERNLLFTYLDFDSSPAGLLRFILEGEHYELNQFMVRSMIKQFGILNQQALEQANYSAIKEAQCPELISYVDSNINEYVQNVFLAIENNCFEPEQSLLELLNKPEIDRENKNSIVKKTKTKVSNASLIDEDEVLHSLFEENKISPTWENLEDEFRRSDYLLTDRAINFINDPENAENLSKSKMPLMIKGEEDEKMVDYAEGLILREEISDPIYPTLLRAVPSTFEVLGFENLSNEKVKALLNSQVLDLTIENYERLNEYFTGLHIDLIESDVDEFFNIIDELELDSNDLRALLRSKTIENYDKILLVSHCPLESISKYPENLIMIANILLADPTLEVYEEVFECLLLTKEIGAEIRIQLFAMKTDLEDDLVEEFLIDLGQPYERITNKRKKAKVPKTPDNIMLLDALERKGYISSYSEVTNFADKVLGTSMLRVNHKRTR